MQFWISMNFSFSFSFVFNLSFSQAFSSFNCITWWSLSSMFVLVYHSEVKCVWLSFTVISSLFSPSSFTPPWAVLMKMLTRLFNLLPCFQSSLCISNANGQNVNVPLLQVIADPTLFDVFYPVSVFNPRFLSNDGSLSGRHSADPYSPASPSICL